MPSTLSEWLHDLSIQFSVAGIDSARSEAEQLLMHVCGLSRWQLWSNTAPLTAEQTQQLTALLQRRLAREPLQLLLGYTEFYGLTLEVAPQVLIPRPETEMLVEYVLAQLPKTADSAVKVLDVCTGSGAIALAIKANRSNVTVWATDLSAAALALARTNGQRLQLEVCWLQTDLCQGVTGLFDIVVANPPYLPIADRKDRTPELQAEPDMALYSVQDGLALSRRLLAEVVACLQPSGQVWLELDPRNAQILADWASTQGWQAWVYPDLNQRMRFVQLKRVIEG